MNEKQVLTKLGALKGLLEYITEELEEFAQRIIADGIE